MMEKENCKSCGACSAICPAGAITMETDAHGFQKPQTDNAKCIHCGLCDRVCARAQRKVLNHFRNCYAARSRNPEYLMESRSGGVFRTAAEYIAREKGGIIYGAAFSEGRVRHIRCAEGDDLRCLSGSKYVWSDHIMCFSQIESDLGDGRYVVFSGLPCQVAGLKSYLSFRNISRERLILCDIVCHGCPSDRLFSDYLIFQEEKHKKKISNIDFRNKKDFGWKAHIESLYLANGKAVSTDVWAKVFYSHYGFDNCCYQCEYKSLARVGDLSLADCWGIEKTSQVLNDDRGTSLLLINSEKAAMFLKEFSQELILEEIDIKNFMQPALGYSVEKPKDYDRFWEEYDKKGFRYVLRKYIGYGIRRKIRLAVKKVYFGKRTRY